MDGTKWVVEYLLEKFTTNSEKDFTMGTNLYGYIL